MSLLGRVTDSKDDGLQRTKPPDARVPGGVCRAMSCRERLSRGEFLCGKHWREFTERLRTELLNGNALR
jgi:hypothetical protein